MTPSLQAWLFVAFLSEDYSVVGHAQAVAKHIMSQWEKPMSEEGKIVRIDYTNWRGVRAWRRIEVIEFFYGRSPFHGGNVGPRYFVTALDLDRGVQRDFALSGIHAWEDAGDTEHLHAVLPHVPA